MYDNFLISTENDEWIEPHYPETGFVQVGGHVTSLSYNFHKINNIYEFAWVIDHPTYGVMKGVYPRAVCSKIHYYSRSSFRTEFEVKNLIFSGALKQLPNMPVLPPGPVLQAPVPSWEASCSAERPWEAAEEEAAQELAEEARGLPPSLTAPSDPFSGASTQSWWRRQVGKRGLLLWLREAHVQALQTKKIC